MRIESDDDRHPPHDVTPESSGPSVNAGERVTRGKHGVRGEVNSGGAGLIVRRTGGAPGRFVLTCAHVLGPPAIGDGQQLADANVVYSPELSRSCGADCSNPVGQVVPATLPPLTGSTIQARIVINGASFAVDAALVELAAKAGATNEIPDIGVVAGVRDLITEWALSAGPPQPLPQQRQIAVRKYGPVTKHTRGRIIALREVPVKEVTGGQVVDTTGLIFEVEAVLPAGTQPTVARHKLDMGRFDLNMGITSPQAVASLFAGTALTATIAGSASAPVLVLTGDTFSQPGDSGSPILDADRKLVGFVTGGTIQPIYVMGEEGAIDVRTGRTHAMFAAAALRKLQVEPLPPGAGTAGQPVAAPGMTLARGSGQPVDWAAVYAAQDALERSEVGADLAALVRRHLDEVRQLVHHDRRVLVTWHRHRGPGFVNAFLRSAGEPGSPLPRSVGGVRLVEALGAMRDVLSVRGSPALRYDIAAHQARIMQVASRVASVADLVRWRAPDAAGEPGGGGPLRVVNSRGVPGAAGALVRDPHGTRYLLVSHHVLFGAGGRPGDRVWATPPGAPDGDDMTCLGYARPGAMGRVTVGGEVSFVDAALVELAGDTAYPPWLAEALAGDWPAQLAEPVVGARVTKHGPVTGTTEGVVIDTAYPDHPFIGGRTWSAPGQLLVDPADPAQDFSAPGDSGAALLDGERRLVGLLWGTNAAGQGLACPVRPLLEHLGVALAPATDGVR